jgi:Tol biopolymer transport system component
MEARGGNVRRLFEDPFCLKPSWSPDGERIAFFGMRSEDAPELEGHGSLPLHFVAYVIDADGKNLIRLTKTPAGVGTLEWSPDSKKIAFVSAYEDGKTTCIYTIDSSGKNEKRLPPIRTIQSKPRWSPDGKRILFLSKKSPKWTSPQNVFTINADGSGTTQVTDEAHGVFSALWSPDGKRIACQAAKNRSTVPTPTRIVVIHADGTNRRVVGDVRGTLVTWTPDGKDLLLHYRNLRVLNLETGQVLNPCKEFDRLSDPVLSPNGDRVLFTSSRSGNLEIYSLMIHGGAIQNLTKHPARDGDPCWGPCMRK